jgi:hypothetical protein
MQLLHSSISIVTIVQAQHFATFQSNDGDSATDSTPHASMDKGV